MTRGAKRDFLSLADLAADEIVALLERADALKRMRHAGQAPPSVLAGKTVALIFEKPSTRTRVSFEVAVVELGGHPVVLGSKDTQLGRGEPIEDTARVLSGYVHAIVMRTFDDARLAALARAARVPVINALTDGAHPCQILADLQTVRELRGTLALRYAWIGDGNNVANSWIEAAGLLGFDLMVATPAGFEPDALAVGRAGGRVRVIRDPHEAVRDADVVVTDVWASMGQEDQRARREAAFRGFCVDREMMRGAHADAIVLHCLPAHRGEEIDAAFIDPANAPVWVEAENRLHAQKALLELLVR